MVVRGKRQKGPKNQFVLMIATIEPDLVSDLADSPDNPYYGPLPIRSVAYAIDGA